MLKISNFVLTAVWVTATISLAVIHPVKAQEPPFAPFPDSAFEAFAARPAAVTWSKAIGSLDSKEARATVTALVVQDGGPTPSTMRGLRIDLAHIGNFGCDWKYKAWNLMCNRTRAALYIESAHLDEVRDSLKRGSAKVPGCEYISQYRGGPPESSGVIVCGYQFADRSPDELAALITEGIAALRGVAH